MELHGEPNHFRPLRVITILTWIPAFAFLLPYGIISEEVCPALGLIPISISAGAGVVHVFFAKAMNRAAGVSVDILLTAFLIGILIPSWVIMAEDSCRRYYCRRSSGLVMLGTYGTTMLMVNFCIHAYFCLRQVPFQRLLRWYRTCPHCQGDLRTSSGPRVAASLYSHDSKESYHSVPHGEEDAESQEQRGGGKVRASASFDHAESRDSFADESAPLV